MKTYKQITAVKVKTSIPGVYIIPLNPIYDKRGAFTVTYNTNQFRYARFHQDNQSINFRGVLRGLHMQKAPHAQCKLVRVVKGRVLDVVVDMRPNSKTYLQHYKRELSAERPELIYIPAGCLHGFLALEDGTIFQYKVAGEYHPEAEQGYRWNDPALKIDWNLAAYGLAPENLILSDKDASHPLIEFVDVNQDVKDVGTSGEENGIV